MITVLLVDDEYAMVEALRDVLEDEGYRVVTAANGKEAMAKLAEAMPAIVLLDLMMPIMDGGQVLAAMRARDAWRDIPVILMSAAVRAGLALDDPRVKFVTKPFDVEDLLRTMDRFLGAAALSPQSDADLGSRRGALHAHTEVRPKDRRGEPDAGDATGPESGRASLHTHTEVRPKDRRGECDVGDACGPGSDGAGDSRPKRNHG